MTAIKENMHRLSGITDKYAYEGYSLTYHSRIDTITQILHHEIRKQNAAAVDFRARRAPALIRAALASPYTTIGRVRLRREAAAIGCRAE